MRYQRYAGGDPLAPPLVEHQGPQVQGDETQDQGETRFVRLLQQLADAPRAVQARPQGAGAELDPGWVVEVTQFIERAPNKVAGVFALAAQPHGQESLWRQLLAVMRSRGSLLKPGCGLLISRAFYA